MAADPPCVARVGQRFGALHVANVLRGHASEQVIAKAHDRLSTFGLLRGAAASEVRGYIQQLTALGLLRMTDDPYAVLALTAKGLALLKDETSCPGLTLARQRAAQGRPRTRSRASSRNRGKTSTAHCSNGFARSGSRPRASVACPHVIFHDATLREMARLRPISRRAPLGQGIGARKADDLGPIFLSAIREHPS